MSPDRRHGREAARRRAAVAAARAEAHRRRRRMQVRIAAALGVVVVLALIGALFIGGDDDETTAETTDTTAAETDAFDDEDAPTVADDPDATTTRPFSYGTGECPPAEKPAEPPASFDAAPKRCLEDGVDYAATVETSEGTFTIDLLEDRTPGAVNNFVVLAQWGWFDGVMFHRVVPGFVNQTGDRTGDPPGTGGPGYTFADELPAAVSSYVPWSVAMANSGPNTNGSQWFTCIDCSKLPAPGYSLFGQVVEGRDVVEAINDLGTGDGPPSTPVTITAVTITES